MNFIDYQLLPFSMLEKSYNSYLVSLSILIAIIASFTAFGTSERIHACLHLRQKRLWIIFGAITMGIGIWSMHFIGSLALSLPVSVSYHLPTTLLSVIPAILASSVVLWLINQSKFDLKRLLFCGLLLSAGIGSMHYIGMAAMRLDASVVYIKSFFILSFTIAIILATISLKINFETTHQKQGKNQILFKNQMLSATLMGFAVSGMHYTAMFAVVFIPSQHSTLASVETNTSALAIVISLVVFIILLIAYVVPHMLRFRQMIQTLQDNEEDLKIAAIAFQTHEAIMVTNENAQIIRVNEAFTRVTGYTETEIIGKNPRILKSGKHDQSFYINTWNTIINEGKWSGEVWNRRKNGEIFPEWQTITTVKNQLGETTHYVSFFSDITEFKLAEQEIEKLAFYDSLTDLPNRRLLYERLEHQLTIAKRYQRTGILFFLDLDRFKHINDSLGHSVGDQILIETGRRLQSLLRETDTAVRLGGDEFVILVSAQEGVYTDLLEQSNIIADKIINEINKPFFISDYELFITTSIGITLFTGIDDTAETLIKKADAAMYQAKESGRNTFRFYQKSMQEVADNRLKVEQNLRAALDNEEFILHYQPQLSDNNEMVGVEALIRWQSPDQGEILPAEFITIAEESSLIKPIGLWVIRTVCKQIRQWDKQGVHIPHVSINISAKQFHQADFVSMLVHTTFEHKIRAKRIMLEITESVFLGNFEEVKEKMNALKRSGFSFSIDDFGTGYSSLTYLKRLPFDQLKIDQSFIQGMAHNTTDSAIVKTIIVLASSMNLNLIAEGVETEQQLVYLSDFGCHYYQGFYFSKAISGEHLIEYIKQNQIKIQENSS